MDSALSPPMVQPEGILPLVDQGIIQEVVRPLMSGKEAQIYLVISGGERRVAKVYKTAQNRTFRQRTEYTEGRAVRNTRTQRARNRHSRFGRAQDEAAWRSAEVDIIYRLRAAGVRVPEPHLFMDGVLVMELVTDVHGNPAPRLADLALDPVEAKAVFGILLSGVVKMLHAGVVHGDLSVYNVLMGHDGPVMIDFPQAVDPAHNQSARKLLLRDVENMTQFLVRSVPGARPLPYGPELWDLYARGELTPDTRLTGRYEPPKRKADAESVLYEIEAAAREAERRRGAMVSRSSSSGGRAKPAPGSPPPSGRRARPTRGQRTADRGNADRPGSRGRGGDRPTSNRGKSDRRSSRSRGGDRPASDRRGGDRPAVARGKERQPGSQATEATPGSQRRRRRRRKRRRTPSAGRTDG